MYGDAFKTELPSVQNIKQPSITKDKCNKDEEMTISDTVISSITPEEEKKMTIKMRVSKISSY